MQQTKKKWVRRAVVTAVGMVCSASALAIEFETEGGWRGSLNTTVGVSAGWRMQDPDKKLILAKNAAAGGLVDGFTPADTYPGYPTAQYAGSAALRGTIATLIATTTPGASVTATAGAAALRLATGKSPVTNLTLAQALVAAGVPAAQIPAMIGNTLASVNGAVFATLSAAGNNATGLGVAAGTIQVPGAGAATSGAIGAIAGMAAAQAGVAAGFLGGAPADDANMNYKKGDRYSTNLKVLSELSLQKGDTGGLLRVKGWYDDAQKNGEVPWGHQLSGYAHNKPYSDDGVQLLNRYDGIALLDAYAYSSFDVADMPLQVRLGRQAVNWGESLFIQGINQLTPLDVTALRKPGTEIKEALLPVWSIYGNLGLPAGMSLEGFYQFKWEPSAIDTCGTYWSPVGTGLGSTPGLCNMATSLGFGGLSNRWAYLGSDGTGPVPGPGTLSSATSVGSVNGRDAKDGGQWGVALRFPIDAIDTEFGVYAMNIHSRTPILSGRVSSMLNATYYNPATRMVAFWEYPEDIQIYGLSAATTLMGWSVGAEVSLQKDVPVQINGNDMLLAGLLGSPTALGKAGPVGDRVAAARAALIATGSTASALTGGALKGYDRFDKKQFQLNGVYLLPSLLGATTGMLVAEAGFQWSDVSKNDGVNVRYGRGFIYGFGSHSKYLGSSGPGGDTCATQIGGTATLDQSAVNPNPTGCKNDGYTTDFAWGYRIRASLEYPNVFESGWNATPSIFFLHDVDGYSMDTQFNEGRKAVSLGLRMSLNRVHNIDLGYTTYANSAKYDAFRDRDNMTFAYSYTF